MLSGMAMSRRFIRPTILLLDPRESSDVIAPGFELDVMWDWIKQIDGEIQVHVNRGTEYQAYWEISHVVGVFPQTTKMTEKYVEASTGLALSQVLTLPPSPDQEESSLKNLLSCSKKFTFYIPGRPLQEDWSKRIQAKHIIFVPLHYATEEEEKSYTFFENTIRFIVDVTSSCKNTKDAVQTILEVVSAVHFEDKRKEVILLCNEWTPGIDCASFDCDIRFVKVNRAPEVLRFYNDSIWLLPGPGTYINWISLQPTLHGLLHVMHKDHPVIKTVGDIPAEIEQNILWDGKDKSSLMTIIQAIIDDPLHAVEKVKTVSLFLQECDVVCDSRQAIIKDILGSNTVQINLSVRREDQSFAAEETSKFLNILKRGFRRTLSRKENAPRSKADKNTSQVNLCKSVFSRLPAKIIGVEEGSVVLLMYVPDDKTYEMLDQRIQDKTIGQDLGLIILGAWEEIFLSPNILVYNIYTSLQKPNGESSGSSFQLNATDNHGDSLLHRSAWSGAVKIVKYCLEKGHDPNVLTLSDQTALHLACSEGHVDVCQLLLNHGAARDTVSKTGRTALHLSSCNGHVKVCELLLHHGAAKDLKDKSDQTALHLASDKGHVAVCQLLLDHGVATDTQDKTGRTALHLASCNGHVKVCELLLHHGAAKDLKDKSDQTALHLASDKGHVAVCQFLLDHGVATDTQGKVIKDPIHSPMRMRPECIKIIDTPQFQRLRYIKQLGSVYYVFPGASHKRFEHSLGVAQLAELLAKSLQEDLKSDKYKCSGLKQLEVQIRDDDVLCVTLAGLCHDLGHGPFSHTFEDAMKKLKNDGEEEWKHEDASVKMFEYIMDKLPGFKLTGHYSHTQNVKFITELIGGPKTTTGGKKWPYEGRPEEMSFLYEIVNNAWSGIDVDKWDYFARDSHHLGIQNTFDHRRYMQFARIVKCGDPERFHICPRDKEAWDVYDLFNTRYMLARKVYCHQVTIAIDLMIRDAIVLAAKARKEGGEPAICFTTKDGKRLGIKEAVTDMEAYTKMNDGLYHTILHSEDPSLEEARTIIERIETRDIYKCIGQAFIEDLHFYNDNVERFEEELKDLLGTQDILLKDVRMSYGEAEVNVDDLDFWDSNNPDKAKKMKGKISKMLPKTFEDVMLYVYVTTPKPEKDKLKTYHQQFLKWCDKKLTAI